MIAKLAGNKQLAILIAIYVCFFILLVLLPYPSFHFKISGTDFGIRAQGAVAIIAFLFSIVAAIKFRIENTEKFTIFFIAPYFLTAWLAAIFGHLIFEFAYLIPALTVFLFISFFRHLIFYRNKYLFITFLILGLGLFSWLCAAAI